MRSIKVWKFTDQPSDSYFLKKEHCSEKYKISDTFICVSQLRHTDVDKFPILLALTFGLKNNNILSIYFSAKEKQDVRRMRILRKAFRRTDICARSWDVDIKKYKPNPHSPVKELVGG
jgi:hypothetical protein